MPLSLLDGVLIVSDSWRFFHLVEEALHLIYYCIRMLWVFFDCIFFYIVDLRLGLKESLDFKHCLEHFQLLFPSCSLHFLQFWIILAFLYLQWRIVIIFHEFRKTT